MFCPQCSQQQVSREVRFCSRCGFPLDGVAQLLANGGVPSAGPAGAQEWEYGPPSPRLKGVRQGVVLWMAGLFLLPLLIVLVEELHVPEAVGMLATMLLFMGGFVRMVYAMLFEDGPLRRRKRPVLSGQAAAQLQETWAQQQRERASLPPGQSIPSGLYAPPRADTSEIAGPPPSVTENTTRLLKDEQQERG